jgi:hypothetical protein
MHRIPAIALCLLASAVTALAAEDNETIRQSFGAPAQLEVRNVNGRIRVTAANTPNIQLVAAKHLEADDQADLAQLRSEVRLDIQETGGRLRICVIQPWDDCRGNENRRSENRRWRDRRDFEVRVDLELQVPARTEIDLRVINGPVEATGIQAPFRVESVNGKVTLTEMEGSGSAHAVNGAIKLSFARVPTDPVDVKTVNGEIEAVFPRTTNAKLSFKTFQGEVFTDFPTTGNVSNTRNGSRWNQEFSVNIGSGGNPEHRFETLNGRIQIAQR